MPTLLRVETEFLSVEIQGRIGLPVSLAALGPLPRLAHLQIESSDGAYTAWTSDGSALDLGVNQPAFFEEAGYWIVLESRVTGMRPIVLQRDTSVIARHDEIADHGIATLTVVYRRQVGRSEWRFRVGDAELRLELEVFPAKLDYDVDYEALVADVTDAKRALALEYFRATHRLGSLDRTRIGEQIEWITIMRDTIGDLARSIQQVNRAPHRGLLYDRRLTPLHQIRGATPSTIRGISRGEGVGKMIDIPGVGKARAWLPVERVDDTLDTFEHRWLRSRLRFVHSRLLALVGEQNQRSDRASKRGRTPTRLLAERDEIRNMALTVEQLLVLPAIEAATADVPASFSSLQLQSATGYSEAYRTLTALGSALGVDGDTQPYSLSDLSELYEVWCFLRIVRVATEITGAQIDLSETLTTSSSGLRFQLVKGAKSSVTLQLSSGSIVIVYNEEYRMPTGVQRPDIVVHIRPDGQPEQIIALDAKYRLDASTDYVAQFGSPGAPTDAVNALHRYRDAIRPKIGGERLPVLVAGAALFPWQYPLASAQYGLRRSLDEVGIGALPFLPGNDANVIEWLDEMIKSSFARGSYFEPHAPPTEAR